MKKLLVGLVLVALFGYNYITTNYTPMYDKTYQMLSVYYYCQNGQIENYTCERAYNLVNKFKKMDSVDGAMGNSGATELKIIYPHVKNNLSTVKRENFDKWVGHGKYYAINAYKIMDNFETLVNDF